MGRVVPVVRASDAARAAVRGIVRATGPLVIVQSAGCCDGSAPMVLPAAGMPLQMQERADPEPADGQIRVKVGACGVCRTDLHVVDGEFQCPVDFRWRGSRPRR